RPLAVPCRSCVGGSPGGERLHASVVRGVPRDGAIRLDGRRRRGDLRPPSRRKPSAAARRLLSQLTLSRTVTLRDQGSRRTTWAFEPSSTQRCSPSKVIPRGVGPTHRST